MFTVWFKRKKDEKFRLLLADKCWGIRAFQKERISVTHWISDHCVYKEVPGNRVSKIEGHTSPQNIHQSVQNGRISQYINTDLNTDKISNDLIRVSCYNKWKASEGLLSPYVSPTLHHCVLICKYPLVSTPGQGRGK